MIYRTLFLFLTIIVGFPATSHAETLPINPDATLKIGLNTSFNSFDYHVDNQTIVMPQAFYDNNKLYIEGSEAGAYFYKDSQHEWRATIDYDSRTFDPKDAKTEALKQLDKRKWSALVGSSYMRITPYGGFKIKVATDTLNRHDGTTISLSHLSKFTHDKWTIYPEIGIQWSDKKYNNYYYGISANEATKSGLPTYQTTASLHPFLTVGASYTINKNWSAIISQHLEYISDKQHDSPLVNNRTIAKTKVGFNYAF